KKGFEPVFIRLSQMVNTEKFQTFMDNVANTVIAAGAGIVSIMDSVATVANFIYEHWSIIAPVLFAVATAMVAIKTVTLMVSAAQWLLNAALLACPLTWVLGGIILLIAAIPLLVLAINHFAGTSISAAGAVVAVIAWAGMAVYNTFALVLNTGLAIVNGLWNGFAAFGNFLANCFIDPVGAIANLFADLANTVLGFIKSMASGVDTLLGTNSAGAIQKLQTKVTYWAKSKTGAEYKKIMPTVDFQLPTYNLKNVWNKSYKFGKSLGDNSFLDKIKNGMPDIGAYAGNYTGDNGSVLGAGKNKILDKVGNVGSVDKVNSEIDIADESLKYLVDGIIRGNINNINLKTTQPNFK
ncbi:MAG: hypothetical protein RR385_10370, partial [Clostridiales bacterium]